VRNNNSSAVTAGNNSAKFWDLNTGACTQIIALEEERTVTEVSFVDDNTLLTSGTSSKTYSSMLSFIEDLKLVQSLSSSQYQKTSSIPNIVILLSLPSYSELSSCPSSSSPDTSELMIV
jgi:WD40 repeat protein